MKKTVKGWLIKLKGRDTFMCAYMSKIQADYFIFHKYEEIIPCTVTYELPAKKAGRKGKKT